MNWKTRWGNFSILLMALFIAMHLVVLFFGMSHFLPKVWNAQIASGWAAITAIFIAFSVANCLVEFFTHRYILHTAFFELLYEVMTRHVKHHALTSIYLVRSEKERTKEIRSHYLIEEENQWQFVTYRDSLLALFMVFMSLFIIPLQLLLPSLPILIGGYTAVAISYASYEILHVIDHQHPNLWISRFHQYHHLHTDYNMAIGGFMSLPLADLLFGTCKIPVRALLNGTLITEEEYRVPRPSRFIVWLDQLAKKHEKSHFLS